LYLIWYADVGWCTKQGPYFIREPGYSVSFSNSTGEIISCIAGGNPSPHVTWQTQGGIKVNEIPGKIQLKTLFIIKLDHRIIMQCSIFDWTEYYSNIISSSSFVLLPSGLRHIRSDNSLVFPPFRAQDYRESIHSNVYECLASNIVGTIRSRDVHVPASEWAIIHNIFVSSYVLIQLRYKRVKIFLMLILYYKNWFNIYAQLNALKLNFD